MARQDVRFAVSMLLLLATAATLVTGYLAETLDLNRFVFHKYPAYVTGALMCLHVYLNRGFLQAWWLAIARISGVGPPAKAPRKLEASPQAEAAGRAHVRRHLLISLASGSVGLLAGWLTSPRPWAAAALGGDVGKLYHDWSKSSPAGLIASALWTPARPPARATGDARIPLPQDFSDRGLALEEAIERRRSIRGYSPTPMSLLQLSRLLHRADGITDAESRLRAAPSAGALYPLEVYVIANNVEGLSKGAYRYRCEDHSLETVRSGDQSRQILLAALGQDMVTQASVVLVLAAVFGRTSWKYRERTYRYVLLECGHVAQNVYLAATSMGLGACAVGAFLDDELNGMLRLDGEEEAALYMISVGATPEAG